MKTLLFLLLLLSFLLAGCVAPTYKLDPQSYTEVVTLRITRALIARDSDAIFRAYFVDWNGQEIPIVSTDERSENELVAIRVMDNPFPRGRQPHRLLSFSFDSPMASRLAPAINPLWSKEQAQRARKEYHRVDLDVLRVFSAKRGEAVFHAYHSRWKGQDIVVIDSLSRSPLKKGGVLPVIIGRAEYPPGREPPNQEQHRTLVFTMSPTGPLAFEPDPPGFSNRAP